MDIRGDSSYLSQRDQPMYVFDTLNSKRPGYPVVFQKQTNGYDIYSQLDFRNDMNKKNDDSFRNHNRGPSFRITISDHNFDLVKCFKSNNWPKIAQGWIRRQRSYNWPKDDVIDLIHRSGCHLVPVGESEESAEWRLSFSETEKILAHTFNHLQLLTYAAMKIVLIEIVQPNVGVSEILCSYFLKTTLFWMSEETPNELWTEKNFLICLHICLARLFDYVLNENCPNYFVPTNNMLTGRLEDPLQKEKLLSIIGDVLEGGLKWVSQSSSFVDFTTYLSGSSNADKLRSYKERKFAVEHISLVTSFTGHMRSYFSSLPIKGWNRHKTRIKNLLRFGHLKWTLIEIFLGKVIRRCSQRKVIYRLEKLHKLIMMKGLKEDPTQLEETYATWLYYHGKYDECLAVTKHALESGYPWLVYQRLMDFQIFHNSQSSRNDPQEIVDKFCVFTLTDALINVTDDNAMPELFYLLEAAKTSYLWKQYFPSSIKASSTLEKERILPIYPETLCRVLRFFCYLRLGEKTKAKEEAKAMKSDSFSCLKPNYSFHLLYIYIIESFLSLMDEYYEKHEKYSSSGFQAFLTCAIDSAIDNMYSKFDFKTKVDLITAATTQQYVVSDYPEDVESILKISCSTLPF